MPWNALLLVYVTWFACLQVHSNVLTWLVPGYSRSQTFRLPKDLLSLGGVERSRARKSNPVRSLWIGAAPSLCYHRKLLFRCPHLCKEPSMVVIYWFKPLWLMNPFIVVPMFLVRVVSTHTRVIPGLVCGRHSSVYSGIQAGCDRSSRRDCNFGHRRGIYGHGRVALCLARLLV